jgi:hypothetical protein
LSLHENLLPAFAAMPPTFVSSFSAAYVIFGDVVGERCVCFKVSCATLPTTGMMMRFSTSNRHWTSTDRSKQTIYVDVIYHFII